MPVSEGAITGTQQDDILLGTGEADTIFGSCGDDWIFGDEGGDRLFGGAGDDSISGGAGRDRIFGGAGDNILAGGMGADIFVTNANGTQNIIDFSVWGGDRLLIQGDYVDAETGLVDLDRLSVQNFGDDLVVLGETDGNFQILAVLSDAAGLELGQLLTARQLGDIPDNTSTEATLVVGTTVSGEFEYGYDADWYRVDGNEGAYYAIGVSGDPFSDDPAQYSDIYLYDENGYYISDYDYQFTTDGIVVTYIPQSDDPFYVGVVDYDGSSGDYLLSAEILEDDDTIPGDASTTATLAVDAPVTSSIDLPFDTDWFAVDLVAGETYLFSLVGDDASSTPLNDLFLGLYDADENFIDGSYGWEGHDSQLFYQVTSDETVYASAEGDSSAYGDYVLSVELFENPDTIAGDISTTATLTIGESVSSTIDVPYDADWFAVELTAGETYVFTEISDTTSSAPVYDTYLYLYDAEGNFIDGNDDWDFYDSQVTYTADTDELVFASAEAFGSNFGDYILSVDLV